MSEPLSTNEIEDVVSSVRRLVSPEARPRTLSRDLGMDRLILTPSLRIVAEQPGSGPTVVKLETVAKKSRSGARKAKAAKAPVVTEAPIAAMTEAGDLADTGAVWNPPTPSLAEMALRAEEAELIIGGDRVVPVPAKTPSRKAKSGIGSVGKAVVDAKPKKKAALAATDKAARKTGSKADAPAAEAVVEEMKVAPVAEAPAVPKAVRPKAAKAKPDETRPTSAKPVATITASPALDEAKAVAAKPARKPVAAKRVPDLAAAEGAADPALPVMEQVEPFAMQVEPEVAYLPVEVPANDPATGVLAEAAALPVNADPLADTAGSFLTDGEGNPISILDEDELMQILRRVIREELQGVLGEKITRNVRKLVRAEIARALTAQTLD